MARMGVFYGAVARDAAPRAMAAATSVKDAALAAMRRAGYGGRRARDADDAPHPGEHFLKAGAEFFHGDHPATCGNSEIRYTGPELSRGRAEEMMGEMGYSKQGAGDGYDLYQHPDDGEIKLHVGTPTKDRRARDAMGYSDDGTNTGNASGAQGDDITAMMGTGTGTVTGMSSSDNTSTSQGSMPSALGGSDDTSTSGNTSTNSRGGAAMPDDRYTGTN